jgi:hypothetical protein
MTKKIPIKDATEAQLRAFGESHLGLTFEANDKIDQVRAKVQAAWNKEDIEVAGDDKKAEKPAASAKKQRPDTQDGKPVMACRTKNIKDQDDLVRVMINKQEGAGGSDDVPLGCNGDVMMVPRGKIVDIPRRYFESLKNAVKNVYDMAEDGKSMNPVPREVADYPYQTYTPHA